MRPPVALAYRALNLGDMLTAVPALRGLRRALPSHHVVLATRAELAPLVPLVGAADELWPVRELEALRWRGPTPDVAVNLHGCGPQSHLLLRSLRPRRLVAFGREDPAVDGPPWRSGEHEVLRWCRLVESAWPDSTSVDDIRLRLPGVPPAVHGAVLIHPGASAPARRWPGERFALVAHRLAATGWPIVVTGSAAEAELVRNVRDGAGLPAETAFIGRGLEELVALVAHARLLVSNDTGVAHLAAAYGTPSVVLFGPVSPDEWGPPAAGPHVALWHGGGGDPHAQRIDPALAGIQADEVLDAAARLLSAA